MPDFELEQLDGEGDPIDLPDGGTVIGRGLFLGLSDKRVSRNHGILENFDGQLRLKPTHVNPCFIQESVEATPQPLEKDKWHCLKDGSIFSLLPGKHVYRVRAIAAKSTPRNSQGYEEDMNVETQTEVEQNPESLRSCEETQSFTPQPGNSKSLTTVTKDRMQRVDTDTSKQVGGAMITTNVPASSTPQKKRVLPAWMLAASFAVQSPSATKAVAQRAPKQTTRNQASSKRTVGPKRAQSRHTVSLSEEEEENEKKWEEDVCSEVEQMPRKRVRRLESDMEDSQEQAPEPQPSQKKPFKAEEVNLEERKEEEGNAGENGAEGTSRSITGGSVSEPERSGNSQIKQQSSLNVQQLEEITGSTQVISSNNKAKTQRRTPCPYGISCYRKNPIHFQECCHPGDDDYKEEKNEDDEDDDRPECPYGTDCYRQNLLHKKEYKHTKPPAPQKSTSCVDDDEDDEDRYEDSFINDESEEEEEVDEDSDYVPESENSGKEDVKQLQREAKAFLRQKK